MNNITDVNSILEFCCKLQNLNEYIISLCLKLSELIKVKNESVEGEIVLIIHNLKSGLKEFKELKSNYVDYKGNNELVKNLNNDIKQAMNMFESISSQLEDAFKASDVATIVDNLKRL